MAEAFPAVIDRHPAQARPPRERILASAYELFTRHGTRTVGIGMIVEHAGVARQTLYRHFTSKDQLVLAFLERRQQLWTAEWLELEVTRRASHAEERLLAIFDVFDSWFQCHDFEGCSFINVLLEASDTTGPVAIAAIAYLARIRGFLEDLAYEAGIEDPPGFARSWHILMKGSILAAGEHDPCAAQRAKQIASLVLKDARRATS